MGTILNLPYKSQYDPDAGVSRNDCGPACLAMLLNAYGITATTDAVFRRTGAAPDQYISVAQLMRVGESYGAPLEYRKGWGIGELRAMLDLGKPVIALVHYAAFSEVQPGVSSQSDFKGPHFVLVIVHDPLWRDGRRDEGAFKKWRNDLWRQAWGRCHEDCDAQGNCNPDDSALIAVRPISPSAKTQVSPAVIRRIRAKAAFDGVPQPDLSQPASVNGYVAVLGRWGQRTVAHRVSPTDTLWRLAKAYYGDGNKMSVIQTFNGLAETDVIHDGQVLLIPEPTLSGEIPEDRIPKGVTLAA